MPFVTYQPHKIQLRRVGYTIYRQAIAAHLPLLIVPGTSLIDDERIAEEHTIRIDSLQHASVDIVEAKQYNALAK